MGVPLWLNRFVAGRLPAASTPSGELTETGRRALKAVMVAIPSLVLLGGLGIALLGSEWRGVLAGAFLAWGASLVVWAVRSFGEGQDELRTQLRRDAEQDVLHARLNLLVAKVGGRPIGLDGEWEDIVRTRMERLAHFSGIDEFRVFDDGWRPTERGADFWSSEAMGLG